MSETASVTSLALPPSLLLELETLRDQRDLFRSLLLCEPDALAVFLQGALETVERIRMTLRSPTRDGEAFRGKIERLSTELQDCSLTMGELELPTLVARLSAARLALCEIEARPDITGDDLLPAMVVLEELCSHVLIAADCAAARVPIDDEGAETPLETSQRPPAPKLATALQRLLDKAAAEHEKHSTLVTMGLDEIPAAWQSTLFDCLSQLVRNAIEHGIELAAHRIAHGKPETGALVIEFAHRGSQGYELTVQDDGAGLDADRIAEVAVGRGLLSADAVQTLDHARLASLIFQPGLTTAEQSERRGNGMQIVRDNVLRLGGRIQVATKRGQFTRYRIVLPRVDQAASPAATHA